jgi:hypothetical protein
MDGSSRKYCKRAPLPTLFRQFNHQPQYQDKASVRAVEHRFLLNKISAQIVEQE